MTLRLNSNSFKDGDYLQDKHSLSAGYGFGCDGENVSPELHWDNVPEGTKSLAITCYDPDAPTGSGVLALGDCEYSTRCNFDKGRVSPFG